jgi:hypothetical protein
MHCVNSGKLPMSLGPPRSPFATPCLPKREGGPVSGQRPVHEPSLALRYGFAVVGAVRRASTLLLCLQSSKISPVSLDVQKHSTLVPALRVLDVLEPLFSCRGFFWPIAIRWTGTIRQLRDLGSVELGKSTCCAWGSRLLPILGPSLLLHPPLLSVYTTSKHVERRKGWIRAKHRSRGRTVLRRCATGRIHSNGRRQMAGHVGG